MTVQAFLSLARTFAAHPLTRSDMLGAWLRFVSWQIRSRLADESVVPWIGGQRLAVRRGMTAATGNLYLGLYEFMSMGLVLHFLRPGDLFLDAGANVGTYTVLASGICGAKTLAIEADAEAGRGLARNIAINGLAGLAEIHAVALGPSEGEVYFTSGHGPENRVVSEAGDGVHLVRQRTLDTIVAGARPAMLKLDVEGYEEQVLNGAARVLQEPELKVILLEGTSPRMLEIVAHHAFMRAFYDPFTRILQRTPNALAFSNGRWTPSNEFFVRDWNFVEQRLATARPVTVLGQSV